MLTNISNIFKFAKIKFAGSSFFIVQHFAPDFFYPNMPGNAADLHDKSLILLKPADFMIAG